MQIECKWDCQILDLFENYMPTEESESERQKRRKREILVDGSDFIEKLYAFKYNTSNTQPIASFPW